MAVRSLRFILTGDDKSASRSLERVGKKADGLSRKLGGLASLGGAALGAGVVTFAGSSIKAFAEAEKSQSALAQSFQKFPKLGDTSLKSMQAYNSALATKTKFDDDAIASGETILATFGLTGDQIKKITPRLLDYATVSGKDLPEAARDLGKATQGQFKALKNVGIQLKDAHDPAKNFAAVMDGLNKKVGGFATTAGQTASGQVTILKNRFGELQETVGEQLLPVVSSLVGWLNDKGVPALQSFADEFKNGTGAGGTMRDTLVEIKDAAQTAGDIANKTVVPVVKWFSEHPDALKGVAGGMAAYATATRAAALWSVLIKPAPPLPGGGAGKGGGKFLPLLWGPAGVGLAVGAAAAAIDPHLGPLSGKNYGGKARPTKVSSGNRNDYYRGRDGKLYPIWTGKPGQAPNPMISPEHGSRDIGARVSGGPIRAGFTYLTGENGPELITAKRSGYVHNAHETSRMLFNPKARLDASQVVDDRLMSRMMMTPLSPYGNVRQGRAPTGMGNYIVVKVEQSRSKTSKAVTMETRRRQRNGHPLPFGL